MDHPALACPKVACRVFGVIGLLTLVGFQVNGCGGDEFTEIPSTGGAAQDASPDKTVQGDASGSGGVAKGGAAGTSQGGKAGEAGSGGIAGGGSGGTNSGGTTGSGGVSGSGGVVGGSAGTSGSGAFGGISGAGGTGGNSGAGGTSGNGGTSGEGGIGGSTGGTAGQGGVGGSTGGTAGQGGIGGSTGGTAGQGAAGGTAGTGGLAGGGGTGGTAVPCGAGYQCLHVVAPTDWPLAGNLSGNGSSSCVAGPLVYKAEELDPMMSGTSACKWTCSPPSDAGCSSEVSCSAEGTCQDPATQTGPVTADCTPFGGGVLYYCHATPPTPIAECTPSTTTPVPEPPLPSSQFACLQPVSACTGSLLGICVPTGSKCIAATGNTAPSCPSGFTLTEYYWEVDDERTCPQATCETLCTDQMGTGSILVYANAACTYLQTKSIPVDGTCAEAGTISGLRLPYDSVCKTQTGSANASGTISGSRIHICCKP